MQVIETISELRAAVFNARLNGFKVGFVPTMGNLHYGHISLVEQARKHCDLVITSIFVNPLQFAPHEDLDTYPRTLEADKTQLMESGCDILFAPSVTEMYPDGKGVDTVVDLQSLSPLHCGITRPHFFKGVATVVVKLLCMVLPDIAFFGEKDRQQLTIIRRVVKDLSLPVEIIGVSTKREKSGLALSSRNGYLNDTEKQQAAFLYQLLNEIRQRIENGARDYQSLERQANQQLAEQGFEPDYFHICHSETLLPAAAEDKELAILAAAKLGNTRLIDNIAFNLPAN